MSDTTLIEVLTGANVALKILQARLVVILALLITAGLFGWAMWKETVLGAIIAGVWGLTIFLPVLFSSRGEVTHARTQDSREAPAQ